MSIRSCAASSPSHRSALRRLCTRGVLAAAAATVLGAMLPSGAAADPWRLAIERVHDDDDRRWRDDDRRYDRGSRGRHGWRGDRHGHHRGYDDHHDGWGRFGGHGQRHYVAPRHDYCPPRRSHGPPRLPHPHWGRGWRHR